MDYFSGPQPNEDVLLFSGPFYDAWLGISEARRCPDAEHLLLQQIHSTQKRFVVVFDP